MSKRPASDAATRDGWDCGDCPYKKPWAVAENEVARLRERVKYLLTTEPAEWNPEVIRWLAD